MPDAVCNHINPAGWLFNTLKKLTMREMKKSHHSEIPLNFDLTDEPEEPVLSMNMYIAPGLTDKDRELILWKVNEELSFEEIANLRGIFKVRRKMRNMEVSLIIPAFNESKIIKSTVNTVLSFLMNNYSEYELIVVDDGSFDDTKEIVESISDPHLLCLSHYPNKGKGFSVREGILASNGDVVVYTDADLAYGIEVVGELVKKLKIENADVAIGSRKLHPEGYRNYPLIRLIASHMFSLLTGWLAGFNYDTQCGLKAFTSIAAKEIFSNCETDSFAFDFEAIMYAVGLSFQVTQLPVVVMNHRDSKVNVIHDSIKMFGDIIHIRRTVKRTITEKYYYFQK